MSDSTVLVITNNTADAKLLEDTLATAIEGCFKPNVFSFYLMD